MLRQNTGERRTGDKMNKKAQGIPLQVIIIAALGLLVLVVLAIIFSGKGVGFDPEKNICTRASCYDRYGPGYLEGNNITQVMSGCVQPERNFKCIEWRSKTKCELNPETEGCVCDKWKNATYEYGYTYYQNVSDIPADEKCDKIVPLFQVSADNNTWQKAESSIIICIKYNVTVPSAECVKSHQRTLQDYNCSVLKKAIALQQIYCNGEDIFKTGYFARCAYRNLWERWGYNTTSEIYDLAEAKGCLK